MGATLKYKKQAWLSAILMFYLIRPYFTWSGFWANNYVLYFATSLLGVLFVINIDKKKGYLLLLAFFVITLGYTINNNYNLIFTCTFIPIVFIPFAKLDFFKEVYQCFLNILYVVIGLSVIVWIFAQVKILQPYAIIEPLNALKKDSYSVYPLLVSIDGHFRFFGPFDEPGVVGTIMGIILCIQKFDFKDKKNIIFLISGLVSFSMFFYFLIFAYYFYYYLFVQKKAKNVILFLISTTCVFIVITQIPALYDVLGSRFAWNSETNTFVGNNRAASIITEYFDSMIGSREFWFGIEDSQKNWFSELSASESSYMLSIIYNGFLFFMSYMTFFFMYGWRHRFNVNTFILFVIVFLGTIYQRPDLYHTEFIFLWSCLALFQHKKLAAA